MSAAPVCGTCNETIVGKVHECWVTGETSCDECAERAYERGCESAMSGDDGPALDSYRATLRDAGRL